jgi:hypothetical protein
VVGSMSARLKQYDVAIGIDDGQRVPVPGCGYAFFVETASSLAEVVRVQGDVRLRAAAGANDLNFLAGVTGHVKIHLIARDGLEV